MVGHRGRLWSRASAAGVLTAVVAALLPATAAQAAHQYLWWNGDGATFATFGANADIRIYQGAVEHDCDWVYPTADIYVVPAGDTAVGTLLHDRSGAPNTVQGASGGLFIEETIGFTAPSGNIGTGRYAVVYDECQDGKIDAGDFVLDPAFRVLIPADIPPLDSRIVALKEQAGKDAESWQRLTGILDGIDALEKVKATIECLQGIGSCAVQYLLDSMKDKIIEEGMVWLGVQDPKDGARKEVDNLIKHYAGIHADPPDPAFQQATPLAAVTPLDPRTDEPLTTAQTALGNAVATQAVVAEALLHSLERYQGADLDDDGTWALNHARAIRDYAAALEGQLAATDVMLRDVQAAFQADTTDFDGAAAALEPLRQRIADDGFTPEERHALAELGQSDADATELRAFIAARDYSAASEAGLQQAIQAIVDGNVDGAATLAALQADMDSLVAQLEADPGVAAHTPVASAGGPYTTSEGGTLTLDATSSSDVDGVVTAYEWDLDRDGTFDDATGAQPTATFPSDFHGLIGVRVTDDDGLTAIGYARITVEDTNRRPTLQVTPSSRQLSGETAAVQAFSATVSDPDGDPVTVRWRVDRDVAAEGATFSYTPTSIGQAVVSVEATDGQPVGGSAVESWAVAVRAPDGDGDGWTATTDCDDTDSTVNPGATEVIGNGKDDDCDPETSDAGSPPRPAFVPHGSGGNVAFRDFGARVAASSGTPAWGHTPEEMLDFRADDLPWASGKASTSPYAVIELADGHPYVIDGVQLRPRTRYADQRVADFAVDVSTTTTDPDAFTTVLTARTVDSPELQTFALPGPITARYVRYRPLSSHGGGTSCGGCISTQQFRVRTSQHGEPTVTFTNQSAPSDSAIAAYLWDFGDGTTSTDSDPTHTFPGPGRYTVTLTATDEDGQSASTALEQQVHAAVAADFTTSPEEPVEGATVQFTDTTTPAAGTTVLGRTWDWGDGLPSSSSGSHVYRDNGTYPTTLEVLDSAGHVATVTRPLTVANVPPIVEVGPDREWVAGTPLRLRRGNELTVRDAAGDVLTCRWNFGDGTSADVCDFDHAYDHTADWGTDTPPKTFTATLTVTDDDGGVTSDSLDIAVRPLLVPSPANLIRNGDFETPSADPWFRMKPAGSDLDGWVVEPHSVDLISTPFADAATSAQSIDLSGSARGGVRQQVATTPGERYQLRFAVAGNIEGPAGVRRVEVYWGETSLGLIEFDTTGRSRRNMGWRYEERTVTATDATTMLRFVSRTEGVYGPFLDDVSLLPLAPAANDAPELAALDDQTLDEGQQRSVAVAATDGDGDAVTLSAEDLPAFAAFVDHGDGTATIALAPGYADAGAYEVTVIADDGQATAARTFTVTVLDVPPPVAEDQEIRTDEDTSASVLLAASGDPERFDVVTGPAHGRLSGDAPDLVYTPDADYHGSDSFTYTASNGAGTSTPATVTITVVGVNDAPVAHAGGPYHTDEGSPLVLSAAGSTDIDDEIIDYTWDLDGDGVFDDAIGAAPNVRFDDDGEHPVAVRVTDAGGLSDEAVAVVQVVNVAPLIARFFANAGLAGAMAFDGAAFAVEFTDPGAADTHEATFTFPDGTRDVAPYTSGQTVSHRFAEPACGVAVKVEVRDDDGGADRAETTIDVGAGEFLSPLREDRQPHATRAGQAVPVKVRITDCGGVERTDLSPAIRLRQGDGVSTDGAMNGPELEPVTRSASERRGVMARNGNHYHYTLGADLAPGRWTILVYPYGTGGPSLRHILDVGE